MLRQLVVAVLLLLPACQSAPSASSDVWQPVRFLTGCWCVDSSSIGSLEVWTQPHGNAMYGQNHSLRGGNLVFFELLAIERRDQQLVYIARPGGGGATEFTMTEHESGAVTFENARHDFPKRIRYRLIDIDTLEAIADDGTDDGKKLTFGWQRVR